jgi:type II secretory pathway pseudopilin PulG
MKKGFTPLEIMIALAISTLLGGLLMQSLYQLTNTLTRVDQISALDMRVIVFKNLLEKELSGAFVPKLVPLEKEAQKTELVNKNSEKKEEKKTVTPEKAFYSQNSNGQLGLLTFITSNPLTVYNMAKAHSARIVYTVVPDKGMPGAFALMRKEIPDSMQKEYESSKGFVVIAGIKSLTVEFLASPEPDNNKEQKTQEKEINNKKKVFKKFDTWDQQQSEQKEQTLPALPQFISMQLVLYNQNKTESAYRCMFAPCYGFEPVVLENRQSLFGQQDQADNDPLKKVMEKNTLSDDLQDKLSQWTVKSVKDPVVTGPVLQGVKP